MANAKISELTAATSTGPTDTMVIVQGGTTKKASMYLGTATNDSASAGQIGEVVTATVAAVATGLTTATSLDVTSISCTAGDWDIFGSIVITGVAASTSFTVWQGGISSTSATLPATNLQTYYTTAAFVPATALFAAFALPTQRFSLASTTTIYLVAQATFTVDTAGAGGVIIARRSR